MDKNPRAALVVSPGNPARAPKIALDILDRKLNGYCFSTIAIRVTVDTYLGFSPTTRRWRLQDWIGDVPGLDNGEWVWSMLTVQYILEKNGHKKLAQGYGRYNQILIDHATPMFYDMAAGLIRGDVRVENPASADTRYHTIIGKPGRCSYLTGEHGVHEGMMMVMFVSLFGKDLPPGALEKIWANTPDGAGRAQIRYHLAGILGIRPRVVGLPLFAPS